MAMMNSLLEFLQNWVTAELTPRYRRLGIREQRLLLAISCLLSVMVLVFLIILPVQDQQKQLRQHVAKLQVQAQEAVHLAAQLKADGGVKPTQSVDALAVVERIARQSKVRKYMIHIRPRHMPGVRGQQLMLQIKDAPYADVVRFVEALSKARLVFNSMKIQRGAANGLVHVRAVINAS